MRWIALAAALLVSSVANRSFAATPKVMPLGDSITEWGYSLVSDGYRRKLNDKLKAAGRTVEWVGSATDNLGFHHEGHSGYHITMVALALNKWLADAQPDIVLLQIGTNDMGAQHMVDAGTTAARNGPAAQLDGLVKQIFLRAPNVALVLAQIPPMTQYDPQPITDPTQKAAVAAELALAVPHYNDAIPAIVETYKKQGRRIALVDMFHALSVADLTDGVHPNDEGFAKMADTWYPALVAMLDAPPPASGVDGGATTPGDAGTPREADAGATTSVGGTGGAAGAGGGGGSAGGNGSAGAAGGGSGASGAAGEPKPETHSSSGCSVGGRATGSSAVAFVLALAAVRVRRRRR